MFFYIQQMNWHFRAGCFTTRISTVFLLLRRAGGPVEKTVRRERQTWWSSTAEKNWCVCVCVCVCGRDQLFVWVSEWLRKREREIVCVRACVCVYFVVMITDAFTFRTRFPGLSADWWVLPGLDWVIERRRGPSSGWMVPLWPQGKAEDSVQQHLFSESDRLTSTVSSSWFSVGDTLNHAMTAEQETVS